jgi:serine/threonine protein kinase
MFNQYCAKLNAAEDKTENKIESKRFDIRVDDEHFYKKSDNNVDVVNEMIINNILKERDIPNIAYYDKISLKPSLRTDYAREISRRNIGKSMRDLFKTELISGADYGTIFKQLAVTLEKMHESKFTFMDLKPDNIVIALQPQVKAHVIDLESIYVDSHLYTEQASLMSCLRNKQRFPCTPQYMSEEFKKIKDNFDNLSSDEIIEVLIKNDIWVYGVILYETYIDRNFVVNGIDWDKIEESKYTEDFKSLISICLGYVDERPTIHQIIEIIKGEPDIFPETIEFS